MKTSSASAPRASSTITHMRSVPCEASKDASEARPDARCAQRAPTGRTRFALCGAAAILGALSFLTACTTTPLPPAPADTAPAATAPPAAPSAPATHAPPVAEPPLRTVREGALSRWVEADWSELPGWDADQVILAWPSLLRSCQRPAPGWEAACAAARRLQPADEARARQWLREHLQPWRVETTDGRAEGLITGYYEPLIEAKRTAAGAFRVPLYAPPAELGQQKPWYSRSQIEQEAGARAALRGREIAHVVDPLDALVLQIQGSGRLWLTEPDGRRHLVRAAFAGHNDHPYKSVGRWLVDRGAFSVDQASWPAIKAWARANPQRVSELIHANPRFVFFREEALPDPTLGPLGAQGVPLTPGRSIAVDRGSVPYGTPVWIDTTEPPGAPSALVASTGGVAPGAPSRPLQRLVVAQDTGSAITGAVRADYFWGWGEGAEDLAGRMKQPLRMWVLWPR